MKEGEIPVLTWLSTLYLPCTCTLKGWKKLAENKEEKKDAALEMKEAAVYHLVKQETDLPLAEETKPSSTHCYCCWYDGNSNSLAKENNLDYLWLFPLLSRKVFFSQEEAPLGSCSGVCGWRCASALLLWNLNSPRNLHCRISKHKNRVILSV